MSARLTSHGAVLQSVSKIRKEICRYDIDILGLACTLYCCDCTLKRITAAACRDECIQVRICCHKSLCCLGTTFGSCTCVLRLRKLCRIIRMCLVPLVNACFVAFPSSKPGCISLLPADQTDVTVTLIKKDVYKSFTVCRLILMYCSDVISRIFCCLINVCAVRLADNTEELCQIYAVVVTCLNCGCHLCIG